jgi:hypothetical protein
LKSKRPIIELAIGIFILCLFACAPKIEDDGLEPSETPVLSRLAISYGLVNVSFAHLLDEPAETGISLGLIRKGNIVELLERRSLVASPENATVSAQQAHGSGGRPQPASAGRQTERARFWVRVRAFSEGDVQDAAPEASGWLPAASLDIYDSLAKVRTARGTLQ